MDDSVTPIKNSSALAAKTMYLREDTVEGRRTVLSRRGLERLDLLLLAIESLDFNGGEAMVWTAAQIGLEARFPNRVELWKRRCHNPLRRVTRRGPLAPGDAEAFITLICSMAERLYPLLHQLLSAREPANLTSQRWHLFNKRISELIQERMNTRRGGVQRLLNSDQSEEIFRSLVLGLALSCGPGGIDRLRASLLDPSP